MSKKSFAVILVFSITISIFGPLVAFMLGLGTISDGFPLKWSTSFGLGSSTDYNALLLDIVFWFVVIFGIKKFLLTKKRKK